MGRRKTGSQRAYERLEKDGDKWGLILYSALALTMCRNWNMKKTAVTRLVNTTWDAWKECAQTNEKSMIMMCEQETGIEIQNGDGVSWRDVAYLNGEDLGPMKQRGSGDGKSNILDRKQAGVARNKLMPVQRMQA